MLIFDRCFAAPSQQWTVKELDYQLQFMLALIGGNENKKNYFPSSEDHIDRMPLPSMPMGDSFVYVVSLIHSLKTHFAVRYPNCVRWSTEQENRWCNQDGQIEHHHSMIFSYQSKDLSVNMHWKAGILKGQQVSISIEAKDHKQIGIELPLGSWKIDQQTNDFDVHITKFEIEMQILVNILCKSMAF